MKCPFCLDSKTRVVDKRDLDELGSIRRRRECLSCKKRFTTYERIELVGLYVVKKDGRRESYNRDKLSTNLMKACEKRPIPRENVERLISEVEGSLRNYGEREVASSIIGELVIERLRLLDKVAYIRFASVYRDFTDLKSFEKELRMLNKKT